MGQFVGGLLERALFLGGVAVDGGELGLDLREFPGGALAGMLQFFAFGVDFPGFLLGFVALPGDCADVLLGVVDGVEERLAFFGQFFDLLAQRAAFALALGGLLRQGVALLGEGADLGLGFGELPDGAGAGALGRFPFTIEEVDFFLRFLEFGSEGGRFFLKRLLLGSEGGELFFARFEVAFEGLDADGFLVFFETLGFVFRVRGGGGFPRFLGRLQGADAVFDFKNAIHSAKPDFVAVVDFGLDDGVAVDEGLVGGVEVFEPVFAVDLDELGVMAGDGGVLDADVVVGFPADGDERGVEAKDGFPFFREGHDETPAQGRLDSRLGDGSGGLQPEEGVDVAKTQRVAVAELGFDHGDAVEPAFVSRMEIFNPVDAGGVPHDLGMVPGDGGVFDLDQVVGGPADGDHVFAGQFVGDGAGAGQADLQRGRKGRLPRVLGGGRRFCDWTDGGGVHFRQTTIDDF